MCIRDSSWIDGMWDLRVFILTSLIISIFTGILNSKIDRNRTLKKQYETYQILKCNSENFICTLCSIAGILVDDAIFMSEAVSYTHLDVYKRQPLKMLLMRESF